MTHVRLSRRTLRIAVLLMAMLIVAACAPATGDLGTVAPPASSVSPSLDVPSGEPTPGGTDAPGATASSGPGSSQVASPPSSPTASPGQTTTLRVYFVLGSLTGNAGLVPVLRTILRTQAVGAAAMNALLAGPDPDELSASPAMYTNVPSGTRFLGLSIANGVATVNLSREFESGAAAPSIAGRLAQVVYTLTQFPTIQSVQFQLDGTPVSVSSSQSVGLARPVTRLDYLDQLPAIFVDRPAWGGVLGNPGRVSGLANVFEAQFRLMVVDGAGHAVTDQPVAASCGSGCYGTFDATVRYTVRAAQWGTLRVFEPSAKDGSPANVTEYRVWLTPPG
jgi:germination protein M